MRFYLLKVHTNTENQPREPYTLQHRQSRGARVQEASEERRMEGEVHHVSPPNLSLSTITHSPSQYTPTREEEESKTFTKESRRIYERRAEARHERRVSTERTQRETVTGEKEHGR